MDIEEKRLIEEGVRLARENNALLKKMRRSQIIRRAFTILYWLIAIAAAFGTLYFLQPYLETLQSAYDSFGNLLDVVP